MNGDEPAGHIPLMRRIPSNVSLTVAKANSQETERDTHRCIITCRRRQTFLRAGVAAVHAPGIAKQRGAAQRAHAVHQQQRVRLAARLAHAYVQQCDKGWGTSHINLTSTVLWWPTYSSWAGDVPSVRHSYILHISM